MYINGEWLQVTDSNSFWSTNPATGEPVAQVVDGDGAAATRAIDAAHGAFVSWSKTTAYDRAELLLRARDIVIERMADIANLMSREQGKPLRAALNEVGYAADFLRWYGEEARRNYGKTIPSARPDQRFITLQAPVGVVAAITPWNYPVSMITRKVAPALAAGCTVVLKPAEATPLCAVAMFEAMADAGIPKGVINLVTARDILQLLRPGV